MLLTASMVAAITVRALITMAYLITIPLVGYARAWAFTKAGDSTPSEYGYLMLNPLVHISFFWLIAVQFFSRNALRCGTPGVYRRIARIHFFYHRYI